MINPAVKSILADARAQIDELPSLEARRQVHYELMSYHGSQAFALDREMERRHAAAADARETVRAIRESEKRGRR